MKLVGCCGPTNAAQSPTVDCERTVNLFPERRDAGDPKSGIWMYATPGLSVDVTAGDGPVVGAFQQNGRSFFISGLGFFERLAGGVVIDRGSVSSSSTPATICSNGSGGNQLLVVVGNYGYVFDLLTNTLAFITDPDFPQGFALMCAFIDGYGLVLQRGTGIFQWSASEDMTDWDALDFAEVSEVSDWTLSLAVDIDRKVLRLMGGQNTSLWYDSGDPLQPFIPVPNALMSTGTAAAFGFCLLDDVVVWISASNNGARMAMEGSGTSGQRISSHAVEFAWSQYSTVEDCIGWAMEYRGHSWAVFCFPTAGATWVYDRSEKAWFEWLYWDATTGTFQQHLVRCHMYAFDEHLGGSRLDGTLYAISGDFYDDAGAPIRRVRRFPHFADEEEWIFAAGKLQFIFQVGVGLEVPSTSAGYDPQALLRISRDAGRTYGNARTKSIGKEGEYRKRANFWRNGRWRDGVIELTFNDSTVCALVGANLVEPEQGLS